MIAELSNLEDHVLNPVVGIDVVECLRFKKAMERTPSILKKLFSENEIEQCLKSVKSYPRFAVRFAAKEAIWKLLGVGIGGCNFHDVEINLLKSGQPIVKLGGRCKDIANVKLALPISISLTHSDTIAVAIAISGVKQNYLKVGESVD